MLPKIIRTGIHRCEGTGVRKTEMATQYRKAYVPVTLDVDKEGAIGSPQHSRNCKVLLAGARAANMPDNETNPKETYYIVSG